MNLEAEAICNLNGENTKRALRALSFWNGLTKNPTFGNRKYRHKTQKGQIEIELHVDSLIDFKYNFQSYLRYPESSWKLDSTLPVFRSKV